MDLLILKKNVSMQGASAYRGTERARPVAFGNLPDSHVANQLFFWFLEEGRERGVVHDLKRAKQLVELLNLFGDSVFYEIVQVGSERTVTAGKGGFLGFDVSAGFGPSLLARCLFEQAAKARQPGFDGAMQELSALHRAYFVPRLNDHRLFQQYEDAEFCLRTMQAMNSVRPGWIEGTGLEAYAVTTLYKLL